MKSLLNILLVLITIPSFGQIEAQKDWPTSIQKEFYLIKEEKIDTFLVYYEHLSPWTNLPDSCNSINSVWILWTENKNYFAKQLFCDSAYNPNKMTISSGPFEYINNHLKDFEKYYKSRKEDRFILNVPTDGTSEHLIFMTNKNRLVLYLTDFQRTDPTWQKFKWIKPTIGAIDITKNELNRNGNMR